MKIRVFLVVFISAIIGEANSYALPIDFLGESEVSAVKNVYAYTENSNYYVSSKDARQGVAEIRWKNTGLYTIQKERFSAFNIFINHFEFKEDTSAELTFTLYTKNPNEHPYVASVLLNRKYDNETIRIPINNEVSSLDLRKIDAIELMITSNSEMLGIGCIEITRSHSDTCGKGVPSLSATKLRRNKVSKSKNSVTLQAIIRGKTTQFPVYKARVTFVTYSGNLKGETNANGIVQMKVPANSAVALSIKAEGYLDTTTKAYKLKSDKTISVVMKLSNSGRPLSTPIAPNPTMKPTNPVLTNIATNTPGIGVHTPTPGNGMHTPTPESTLVPVKTATPTRTRTKTPRPTLGSDYFTPVPTRIPISNPTIAPTSTPVIIIVTATPLPTKVATKTPIVCQPQKIEDKTNTCKVPKNAVYGCFTTASSSSGCSITYCKYTCYDNCYGPPPSICTR